VDQNRLIEALDRTEAGLYFLACLDKGHNESTDVLTIHALAGILSAAEKAYLAGAVDFNAPGLNLQIVEHQAFELREARSLEALANTFVHDRIIADPTGAFSRLNVLLLLVKSIRTAFPEAFAAILWETNAASLILVPSTAQQSPRIDEIKAQVEQMTSRSGLTGIPTAVLYGSGYGSGSYTLVDERFSPKREPEMPKGSKPDRPWLRLAASAVALGFGTMATAAVAPNAGHMERNQALPGIVALVDLTTLGDSAFGTRNPHKAASGLRLFLGEALTKLHEEIETQDLLGRPKKMSVGAPEPDIKPPVQFAQAYGN